jgi:transposase InsO family protein
MAQPTINPATIPLPGSSSFPPIMVKSQPKHDIHKFRSVTHLTDQNWVTHKFEQIAALEERGLYEVVTGEEKMPNKSLEPEAYRLWKDKDVSAKAQIIQNLSKEVQPIVYEFSTTSAEVWKALRNEYESSNLDKVANVRHSYDILAYVEGSGMRDHINKLNILREQLGAMGDAISDTSHALRLLRFLPPSWDGVCQVLRASQPTVAKVKDRLLAEEEARKTAMAFANAGTASALLSVLHPQQIAGLQALMTTQFGRVTLNDATGNYNGGQRANQKTNGQTRERQSKLKNPHLNCRNCGKKGHTKERCWARGGGLEGKGPKPLRVNSVANSGEHHATATSNSSTAEINLAEYPEIVEANIAELSDISANIAVSPNLVTGNTQEWILDSGASVHLTPLRSIFSKYVRFNNPHPIGTADHGSFHAIGVGNIWIKIQNPNGKSSIMELRNVLHAPECSSNIISVNGLTKFGHTLTFVGNLCSIFNPQGEHITQVSKQRSQLYRFSAQAFDKNPELGIGVKKTTPRKGDPLLAMQAQSDDLFLWHRKLGHLSFDYIRFMQRNNLVKGLEKAVFPAVNPKCEHCAFGKLSVRPFPDKSSTLVTRPLQLICIDTSGPFNISIGGKRYLLVFVDAYSRYTWTFYLKDRSEAPRCLKEFIAMVERQSGHQIKTIRSDNAKEFTHGEFREICRELGIEHQTTAPYSSASNGIAERVLRTIQENGKAVLHESGLSLGFWPEAFEYVVHTRNRSFHSAISDIPYRRWFGSPPSIANAHPFGCNVKYLNHPKIRRKGDYHAHTGKFVGYYHDYPAFKIWNPETRQFYKTRSAVFDDSPMHTQIPLYNAMDVDEDAHIPMVPSQIDPRTGLATHPATASHAPNAPTPIPQISSHQQRTSLTSTNPPYSRFPSPLTDIEEVEGSIDPLLGRNIAPTERIPLTRVVDGAFYQTDEKGYRIRPEEHPEHPEFSKFGRVGGKSQRERKPVNRSYIAEQKNPDQEMNDRFAEFPTLLERINKARLEGSTDEFYNAMHAMLAVFDDFEASLDDPNSLSVEDYQAKLAGFNIRAKTYSYAEAMRFPEPRLTAAKEAIAAEIQQLCDKEVWEEVDRPEHMETYLDWQIIVDEKYDADGNFIKTKARVVLRGDRQVEGKDFDETHTNTPSMAAVRFGIALGTALGSTFRQVDIVGAFLAAPINMDVYVKPLPNVHVSPGKVLKLRTALYGLCQSGREFSDYRDEQLRSIGYQHSPAQPSFFFRRREDPRSPHGNTVDIGLWWVDDGLLAIDDYSGRRTEECVAEIASVLEIEDKGLPKSYLGMALHFNHETGQIGINQPGLIDQLVKAARLEDCKDVLTPLRYNYDIPKNTGPPHQPFHGVSYSSLVGGINYLATVSRPDIANAVRVLSSHCSNPSKRAHVQLNNLIAYLKTTRNYVLTFGLKLPFSLQQPVQPQSSKRRRRTANFVTVFSDADWAKEPDRESISGFISFFYGSPINWTSKKQKSTVALSSMESEVIAANLATREAAWIRKMFMLIDDRDPFHINLALDNEAAIYFANADSDTRAKHIDLRYYYIKSKVKDDTIQMWHVRSEINPADIFTKALRTERHISLMRMLGLRRIEEVCWN